MVSRTGCTQVFQLACIVCTMHLFHIGHRWTQTDTDLWWHHHVPATRSKRWQVAIMLAVTPDGSFYRTIPANDHWCYRGLKFIDQKENQRNVSKQNPYWFLLAIANAIVDYKLKTKSKEHFQTKSLFQVFLLIFFMGTCWKMAGLLRQTASSEGSGFISCFLMISQSAQHALPVLGCSKY